MTKLESILAEKNYKISDIKQIYSGKDHWCRCGCKGKYYDASDMKKFKMMMTRCTNAIEADDLGEIEWGDCNDYVNIPNGPEEKDHCYCIYFD